MKFYEYICDSDNFHSFLLENDEEYLSVIDNMDGRKYVDMWIPLKVKLYETKYSGDFPHLSSNVPVFSQAALDVLLPLIKNSVEVLPLECKKV